jgi:hypothetical protein
MATVQITFQDNADNETAFKIYRGASSTVTASDDHILTMTWNSSAAEWEITQIAASPDLSAQIITGTSDLPSNSGNSFVIIYDESVTGTYYYGVSASNIVGDSAIASSGQSVTI